MKLCNHKKCTRHHDTKYKLCPACREISRRSKNKRKRIAILKKKYQNVIFFVVTVIKIKLIIRNSFDQY